MDKDNNALVIVFFVQLGEIVKLPLVYEEQITGLYVVDKMVNMKFLLSGQKENSL